jgi:ribosomal-protein-serine acetyltransferase
VTVLRRELPDGGSLRPWEERDADELFALVERSRAHLAPWMPWVAEHLGREQSLGFIRQVRDELEAGASMQLAVLDAGRIVGVAALNQIELDSGACRTGYWLAPDAQGRGLATRAVAALLGHAFDELGLHRVELRTAPGNARSRRVAERLGFRLEGTLRQVERFGDEYRDQVLYALLAPEWGASRGTS